MPNGETFKLATEPAVCVDCGKPVFVLGARHRCGTSPVSRELAEVVRLILSERHRDRREVIRALVERRRS